MAVQRINSEAKIRKMPLKKAKNFPNSRLPVIHYQDVLNLPDQKNKACKIAEEIFYRNGWSNSWRNGIYDFHHYHTVTHECMAVCRGQATVMLGGPKGKNLLLKKGDVLILPAGTSHKRVNASEDFLCVGAYPEGKDYDMNFGLTTELKQARVNIEKTGLPDSDPVFGKKGILEIWKRSEK